MVSQIGITYKLKNMDMGGYNNLWLNWRCEPGASRTSPWWRPDPDCHVWWFLHSKGNASATTTQRWTALLDGARSELDRGKREAMYHKIVDPHARRNAR